MKRGSIGQSWSPLGALPVATACPLVLAVPVALVANLSRAAHFSVQTDGRPQIVSIISHDGMAKDDILRLASAPEQTSKHPMHRASSRLRRRAASSCFLLQKWSIFMSQPTDASFSALDAPRFFV